MLEENKAQSAWYQKAVRVLELATAESIVNREEREVPPTPESIAAATAFLRQLSEPLSAVATPKVSISENGAITLRWKVSEGRIDVSFSGSSAQAFISTRAEQKAVALSEVSGRVVALLAT